MKNSIMILATNHIQAPLEDTGTLNAVHTVFFRPDDKDIIERIACLQPDVVLLDLFMPHTDAVEIIRSYGTLFGDAKPFFAVLCPFASERLRQELTACGADRLMFPPFDRRAFSELIAAVCRERFSQGSNKWRQGIATLHKIHGNTALDLSDKREPERTVNRVLQELGVPSNSAGYFFLKRAIELAVLDESIMRSVTHTLYPAIAAEFHTTPSCVDRRIRHTIIGAFQVGHASVITSYFGHTIDNVRGNPSNSEFIALLADRIRLTIRERQQETAVI